MVKSKHDDSQPIRDGGTVYYAQGRYVEDGRLWASHPKYCDTLEEVYREVDRPRRWPLNSTDRCVDVCQQLFWWDVEGKQNLGAAELLEAVSFNLPDGEEAEWMALPASQRFARLLQRVNALARSKDAGWSLTASDNAQQLPAERELTPWQQEALIAERDRQLAVAQKQLAKEERA